MAQLKTSGTKQFFANRVISCGFGLHLLNRHVGQPSRGLWLLHVKLWLDCPVNIHPLHRPPNIHFGVEITGCAHLCGAITVELEMSGKRKTHKSNKNTYSGRYEFAHNYLTRNRVNSALLFIGNLCINTHDWPGQLNYPLIIHRSQPNLHHL
jgi:hypothetical protein